MKAAIKILMILSVFIMLSCTENKEKFLITKDDSKCKNALIAKNVKADYVYYFNEGENEGNKNLFNYKFKLLNAVMDNNITVYDGFTFEPEYQSSLSSDKNSIDADEIRKLLINDTVIVSKQSNIGLVGLSFYEEWFFNLDKFTFDKKVIAYSPVKQYNIEELDRPIKTKLFTVKCNNTGKFKKLAGNIKSTINRKDHDSQIIKGIAWSEFIYQLINKALVSEKIALDFYDDSKILSKSDLEMMLGAGVDSNYVYNPDTQKDDLVVIERDYNLNEIEEVMFIEDWYYNVDDYSIKKKVKAIVPIRKYYEPEAQREINFPICKIILKFENIIKN